MTWTHIMWEEISVWRIFETHGRNGEWVKKVADRKGITKENRPIEDQFKWRKPYITTCNGFKKSIKSCGRGAYWKRIEAMGWRRFS